MPIDREAVARDVAHWRGPDDEPLLLAVMYWRRVQADTFYLSLVRRVGAMEAGQRTCARYGHEPAGITCGRCKAPTR